uniref:Secreted protein n=1 Tax=Chromera velia CCMP2878 TaxID=1169474 RepID=A0A0G4HGI9_9ALVE|eukprot:Cvel_27364.t1-p1 / transcript=Cvel_27364.t1 / gene=Cvel_27364 / organism=Chromera_velia_CCMP2878 / gene_product=hypothetical protein / transcript_product=hypothetical protein / location=Cvel_scaffold3401:10673-11224(-) / protein_length=184 / sequence_SO=supercontig / SO=protein_coding / is_pseudo=false
MTLLAVIPALNVLLLGPALTLVLSSTDVVDRMLPPLTGAPTRTLPRGPPVFPLGIGGTPCLLPSPFLTLLLLFDGSEPVEVRMNIVLRERVQVKEHLSLLRSDSGDEGVLLVGVEGVEDHGRLRCIFDGSLHPHHFHLQIGQTSTQGLEPKLDLGFEDLSGCAAPVGVVEEFLDLLFHCQLPHK